MHFRTALVTILLLSLFEGLTAQTNDTTMTVAFSVTTTSPGGNFSPKNIGAIWVEDAAGQFVKTLRLWADRRKQYLYTWNNHTNGNTVDGVTGATYSSHGTRTATWDFTDISGNLVPVGQYTLWLELTDQHSQGPRYSFNFPFHGAVTDITPPEQSNFHNMVLSYDLTIIPGGNFCYEIEASNNWFGDLEGILNAQGFGLRDGDTLMLITDGGNYYTPDNVVLPEVALTIMAAPDLTNKPVLSAGSSSTIIKAMSRLALDGVAFNGLALENGLSAPSRLLRVNTDLGSFTIENCDFYNARSFGITSHGPHLDSLIVSNCKFHHISEDAISFKDVSGLVDHLEIRNSSFWNIGGMAVYVWDASDEVTVEQCTFYDITLTCVYPRECMNLVVLRDNILVSNGFQALKINGPAPIVEYNCFYNNSIDIEYIGDPQLTFPTGNLYADPLFEDGPGYNFRLASISPCVGSSSTAGNMGDAVWGVYEVMAVDEGIQNAGSFKLIQNSPNPFNPSTQIHYILSEETPVQLTIFDLRGELILTLVNQQQSAGGHAVNWDGRGANGDPVTAGVYVCRLQSSAGIQTIKMLSLK